MIQTNQIAIESAETLPAIAIPLLSLAAFAVSISARVTDPLLPQFATEFQVSLGQASATVTLFAVAYGFSQLLFGPLGDRYGKYLVIAGVCIASAMSALLCGLSTNFTMLLVTRLIAGVGAAAVIPLSMAWIGDVVPYQMRQPILARFMVGQILGLSVGAFVGGLAADQLGWRMPFFGIALIFLAAGVALLHMNRRLPAHARAVRIGHGPAIPRMIKEFKKILARPWVRIVLLCVFLEGACIFGALAFIASHVHRTFGMSLTTAGTLVMLFGFGGLLFALASGSLVPRLGEAGMTWVGGGLAASFLLTIGLAPAWWWAAPACFMVGLGFYMLHNTLQINATQMAPERRGAAVSLFASCFYLGQAAGVGAAGLMVEWVGTSPILVAGALGVLLVAMGFFRGLQSRPAS